MKSPKIYEIVKSFELEPLKPASREEEYWHFRIEILKLCTPRGLYFARIWRIETYSIRPTFPFLKNGELRDHASPRIIVEDTTREWDKIKGKSLEDVLEKILKEIY